MTVLVNYAMFSINPEELVNINMVEYEINNVFNASWTFDKEYFKPSNQGAQWGCSENSDGEQTAFGQTHEG